MKGVKDFVMTTLFLWRRGAKFVNNYETSFKGDHLRVYAIVDVVVDFVVVTVTVLKNVKMIIHYLHNTILINTR